jgi:hypothetical protein
VTSHAVGIEKVEWTLTNHLIGDIGIADGDVPGFSAMHTQ